MQEGSTAVALAMVTPGYDQDPASGVADYTAHQDQAQFETDKRAVYKHPLFPLLALLFERCEQATQSSDNSTSESFNMDIQAFVQHQERDRKPFLINDPEIDGLMIKAIQVLRIHLLELEKVQELCKDFCNRYIGCLKGKMQSENLLRSDYSHHGHDMIPSSGSNGSSPLQVLSSTGNDVEPGINGLGVTGSGGDTISENGSSSIGQGMLHIDCGTIDRSTVQPSIREDNQDHDIDPLSPTTIHGGTPLSQIGAHQCGSINDIYIGQDITVSCSPSPVPSEDDDDGCGSAPSSHAGGNGSTRKARQKRGVLPKQATSIMRAWLFQHLVHPYPTEAEKNQIASQTNLTLLQVNNWFINARRRILQPMLDGAGADGVSRTGKRHKSIKNTSTTSSSSSQQQQHQQHHQQLQQQQNQLQQNSNSSSQGQIGGWQSDELASDSGSSDADDIVDRFKNNNNESDDDDIH